MGLKQRIREDVRILLVMYHTVVSAWLLLLSWPFRYIRVTIWRKLKKIYREKRAAQNMKNDNWRPPGDIDG